MGVSVTRESAERILRWRTYSSLRRWYRMAPHHVRRFRQSRAWRVLLDTQPGMPGTTTQRRFSTSSEVYALGWARMIGARILTEPRHGRAARAQALVELALILPVSLVLLLGVIDLGRAFVMGVALQGATEQAARLGSMQFVDPALGTTDSLITKRLIDSAAPFLQGCTAAATSPTTCNSDAGSWTLSVIYSPAAASGNTIEVRAAGSVALFSGFLTGAFDLGLGRITVQGDTQMVLQ